MSRAYAEMINKSKPGDISPRIEYLVYDRKDRHLLGRLTCLGGGSRRFWYMEIADPEHPEGFRPIPTSLMNQFPNDKEGAIAAVVKVAKWSPEDWTQFEREQQEKEELYALGRTVGQILAIEKDIQMRLAGAIASDLARSSMRIALNLLEQGRKGIEEAVKVET